MTQAEIVLLEKGRVPAQPILDRLIAHCGLYDKDRLFDQPGELLLICERQGLEYSTVARIIHRYEHESVNSSLDFNTADKLLCGMFVRWDSDETLEEYYARVDLSWQQCACNGCETWFRQHHMKQLYCSKACRWSARHQRIGRTTRTVKAQRGTMSEASTCRNGHPRTPENIVFRKNGKTECAVCKRAANNASYSRREQAKRMTRLRECEHPECNVSFVPNRTDQRFCSQKCRGGSRRFRVARVQVAQAA